MIKQLYILGLSIQDSPIAERERLQRAFANVPDWSVFCKSLALEGMMPLMTCNRVEWWLQGDDVRPLTRWLQTQGVIQGLNVMQGEQALNHALHVVLGLAATVQGEVEIVGQIRRAWQQAKEAKVLSAHLSTFVQAVLYQGKRLRANQPWGRRRHSMVHAMLATLSQFREDWSDCRFLLIGAGAIAQNALRQLVKSGVKDISLINRTQANVLKMAKTMPVTTLTWQQLPTALAVSDVVITATAAPQAFITPEHVPNKEWIVFDLAVPRNVDDVLRQSPQVFLYNMDDLANIQQQLSLLDSDCQALRQSVAAVLSECLADWQIRAQAETIREFRRHFRLLTEEAVAQAKESLCRGQAVDPVMDQLAHRLLHRLLHRPTRLLRQALAEKDQAFINKFKEMMYEEWL